ncbi:hypothetical protein [Nocardiopsis composta]|uniref:Uncharacterized protein n=1 Tax=Nocardiopsis composta TaxID=157465 RepID=A0A7W8VF58_9ACTN|nr:hypothetical protein [Nocardiopsis composta]MBB5434231.1 hypothetical protein [Nocardiopsis composta]
MRAPGTAALGAVLTGLLLSAAPAADAATAGSGTLALYSAPGLGHTVLEVEDGCHSFAPRAVSYADADPIADYVLYSGRDCTGVALGAGRDATQWIPPLTNVRSVRIDFD